MTSCASYSAQSPSAAINETCAGTVFNLLFCIFYGLNYQRSSSNGGAVSVYGNGSICTIDRCFFEACTAYYGGGIYLYQPYSANVTSSCFYNCYGSKVGQIIYSISSTLTSGVISKCTALFCPLGITATYGIIYMSYGSTQYQHNNLTSSTLSSNDGIRTYGATSLNISLSLFASDVVNLLISLDSTKSVTISMVNFANDSFSSSSSLVCDTSVTSGSIKNCVFISDNYTNLLSNSILSVGNCVFWGCVFKSSNVSALPTQLSMPFLSSWLCQGNASMTGRFSSRLELFKIREIPLLFAFSVLSWKID